MRRLARAAALMLLCMFLIGACTASAQENEETLIVLDDMGVTVNEEPIGQENTQAVYAAKDIVFYLEGQDFTYGEGEAGDGHAQEEADAHTVVHITKPGTYRLSGTLSAGQVAVDLGEEAKEDESAVVTLILDGVNITSTVAPAVIFYNVYECGEKDADTATKDVDTSAAGANVVIADGSVNTLNGSYVARIYEPGSVELSEDGTQVIESKKLHKYDGTLYSRCTMNVSGEEKGDGVLNINAENEGLNSELHLTIDGGVINIASGNDGINTNEDGVSVCTISGGEVNITVTGETGEGDGIDSNGWLVISGGKVNASACAFSGDAGIDADMGIDISGAEVVAGGNMLDAIDSGNQNYAVFCFNKKMMGGTTVTLRDENGNIAGEYAPVNDYTYLLVAADALAAGTYTLWQGDTQLAGIRCEMQEMRPRGGFGGKMAQNFDPERMTPPEDMERPDGAAPGEMNPPIRPEGEADMTPPQMAQGMEQPAGFDPAQAGQRGFGGFGGRRSRERVGVQGDVSELFVIEAGGNMFSGIDALQE